MTRQLLLLSESNVILSHHSIHKQFFNSFIPDFKFSNRKMNKTLTTLIWSVFRSLKVAQASRSHFSEDSTMHYIELSDDQLEYLVNQLFETNSFGYIYQLLIDKLFDSDGIDGSAETEKLLALQTKFGDVQKVEVSTGLLNNIAKQNEDILKLVNELSKDEVKGLISRSMTNTLYSKQRYYQCVFVKCKFNIQSTNIQDCSACPYSIINVYALSNLMNLYLKQINNLINRFEFANDGEKQKLANHFFLLWRQIQAAKVKFGDVIYDFVEGGKERFIELSKQLPKTKKYLSKEFESIK